MYTHPKDHYSLKDPIGTDLTLLDAFPWLSSPCASNNAARHRDTKPRTLPKYGVLAFPAIPSQIADAQLATQFVRTALVAAAENSGKWAVKTLLVIGAAPLEDLNRLSALEAAVEGGSSEMVMHLIQHDVEVNHLYTVYNLGHSKRSMKTLNTLISKSTDVKAEESLKNLALFIAARKGNASIVSLLLSQGAEPAIYDESGASAVSVASSCDAMEVISLLLDAGADCESKDSNGRTPLMIAAANGHRGAVKRLLEADAEWDLEDNSGMSALSHTKAGDHADVILELIKAGANPGLPITVQHIFLLYLLGGIRTFVDEKILFGNFKREQLILETMCGLP